MLITKCSRKATGSGYRPTSSTEELSEWVFEEHWLCVPQYGDAIVCYQGHFKMNRGFQLQYCLTTLEKENVGKERKRCCFNNLVGLNTSSFKNFEETELTQVSSKFSVIF